MRAARGVLQGGDARRGRRRAWSSSSSRATAASRPASLVIRRADREGWASGATPLARPARRGTALAALPRGRYAFERPRAVIEDPFGLAARRGRRSAELGRDRSSTRGSSSSTGSSRRAARTRRTGAGCCSAGPAGFDLHSVREYSEGESLRRALALDREARRADGQGARGRAARRGGGAARRRRARPWASRRLELRRRRCAPRARSCSRTPGAAGAALLVVNSARARRAARCSFDGDWRRALELLAASSRRRARRVAAPARRRGRAGGACRSSSRS